MNMLPLHAPASVRRSRQRAATYMAIHTGMWTDATLGAVLVVAVEKALATLSTELLRSDA